MTLLGAQSLTVTPYTATLANGRYAPVAGTPYVVTGTIVPLSAMDLERLPEGARTSARFALYVEGDPAVKTTRPGAGTPADRVAWNGKGYVVSGETDLTMHSTGLPHRSYVLSEVGDDE